ncbi:MAG: TRAP transporter substrate-binding protein DctP [Burkholderiaceae bacterium]
MNKIKAFLTAVGFLATATFGTTASYAADKPIVWRMHTPHTEGRVVYEMQKDWSDMVMKGTGNRIKVEMYPGGALGFKDADILGAMKNGLIEASYVYGGYYGRDEPTLGMILAQMVFNSREEFLKILPLAFEQYGKLYGEWGIQLASLWPTLNCNVATMGKEPYSSIASLKGKKIRVWEAQQVDTLKQLGVSAVVIPQNDLYLAMKTGVVDGAVHFPEALKELSLYEDAKSFSLMQPVPVAQGIGVSKKALQALPSDLRELVIQTSAKHREKWLGLTQECKTEQKDIDWAISKDVKQLPDFSQEDRKLISDTAIKVWRARAVRVGDKAVKYQQIMEKELIRVRTNG